MKHFVYIFSMGERTCCSLALWRRAALSQPTDGDEWGWFVELEDGGGALGEGPGAADPPTSNATPPYILSVGWLVCWQTLTLGCAR